jgi:uncharacterized Zn-binding protein involved in type VI secretion
MPLLLLDGDTGSHGGGVVSSASKTYAEGSKVVLNGDTYNCSTHGSQTISNPISTKTYAEGKLIALHGSVASCGATIASSATKTYAE